MPPKAEQQDEVNCPRCHGPLTSDFYGPCTKCSKELLDWAFERATAIHDRYENRMADEETRAATANTTPKSYIELLDELLASHDPSSFPSWWSKEEKKNAD